MKKIILVLVITLTMGASCSFFGSESKKDVVSENITDEKAEVVENNNKDEKKNTEREDSDVVLNDTSDSDDNDEGEINDFSDWREPIKIAKSANKEDINDITKGNLEWEIYASQYANYSVKYPKTYEVSDGNNKDSLLEKNSGVYFSKEPGISYSIIRENMTEETDYESFQELYSTRKSMIYDNVESIEVGNNKFVYGQVYIEGFASPGESISTFEISYDTVKGDKMYSINFSFNLTDDSELDNLVAFSREVVGSFEFDESFIWPDFETSLCTSKYFNCIDISIKELSNQDRYNLIVSTIRDSQAFMGIREKFDDPPIKHPLILDGETIANCDTGEILAYNGGQHFSCYISVDDYKAGKAVKILPTLQDGIVDEISFNFPEIE